LNFGRLVGLLVLLAAVAVALVHLRTEQTRATARMLAAETRRNQLRRELWSLQVRTARLKSPARIRERIDQSWPRGLLPPGAEELELSSAALTAGR